jgi:hypothetical protein
MSTTTFRAIAEEPGAKRPDERLVPLARPPGAEERLLHRLLREPAVVQTAQGEAEERSAVLAVGGPEACLVLEHGAYGSVPHS